MPSTVRATLTNGEIYTLEDPTVRNDTIFGATDSGVASVAAEDVGLFEVSRFNAGETLWGISGLVTLVLIIIGVVSYDGF